MQDLGQDTVMVHYCVAYGCSNHQGGCAYGFHRFPADLKRREAWEAAIRREHWRATNENVGMPLNTVACVVLILLKVQ